MNDDLPIIQCQPTPTDAELEAERDAKHALAVREWFARQTRPEPPYLDDPAADHIPARAVQG